MTRIALIGNMNNNNFAMMRYLRDLGEDAQLFTYGNELDHFRPQVDTTDWEKWRSFVHPLGVSNGGREALFGSLREVENKLAGFDKFLGNGIAPVVFHRLGRTLDLFIPYGEGCEFISEFQANWKRPLSTAFQWVRKRKMKNALRTSVGAMVIGYVHPRSRRHYRGVEGRIHLLPLLTKYDPESVELSALQQPAREAIDRMTASSLAVFSQSQHRWVTHLDGFLFGVGKRNHWLIMGFAQYVKRSGDARAVLCLLEYGPDVAASKALIDELGIAAQVVWLPMMSRLELLAIARHADVGADAFHGSLWGGTGWELISLGVPLLHAIAEPMTIHWAEIPLPPFLNADSPEAIANVLLSHDRAALAELGRKTRDWHERYQGKALAKRYLDLLDGRATAQQSHDQIAISR